MTDTTEAPAPVEAPAAEAFDTADKTFQWNKAHGDEATRAVHEAYEAVEAKHKQKAAMDPIAKLIEPRAADWQREFGGPDKAVGKLLELSDFAGRDPAGFHRWFAAQHGLNTAQPTPSGEPAGEPTAGGMNNIQENARRNVASFAEKAPHFEDVREQMGDLIASGQANSLQDAYRAAVQLNPEVRKRIAADEGKRQEAERERAARKAKEKKAKRLASDVMKFERRVEDIYRMVGGRQK